MAATGYTPISLYYSSSAGIAPSAGNLVNGELGLNITDGKLYYKDNLGAVQVIAGKGGAGVAGGSNTQIQYNSSGSLAGSANMTYDGSTAWFQANSSADAFRITQTGSGNALVVEDSANPDSTPFVINQFGRVLVGNNTSVTYGTDGSQFLQINSTGYGVGTSRWTNDTGGAYSSIAKSRSTTVGTYSIVSSGDEIGGFNYYGDDGVGFIKAATINAYVDGTPGTNDMPGRLVFSTTADGASSPTERMRIDNAGAVGIGGTPSAIQSLVVFKNLTGGTSVEGITSRGQIQSSATSNSSYFKTLASTAATAFTAGSILHYESTQGTIGAGSAVTNQYGFYTGSSLTGATNNYGFYGSIASGTGRYNFYAQGSADNYMAGSLGIGTLPYAGVNLYIAKAVTGGTSAYEQINGGTVSSDVTAYAGMFESYPATQAAAFTLGQLTHFGAGQGTIGAGSTVNNQYGFNAKATLTGATNNFGFYGDIASGSNRFNFYANGTADNYFNGKVGIGAVPIAGSKLSIAGSTTETSSSSVLSYQTIASASTSSWNGFATFPSTQAAAFTLPILRHYTAGQGTIGAGSTVTSQYGFNVDAGLTGATNNYGFYGAIAAGANRYNLYMQGSADNYMAGGLGIGSLVGATQTLKLGKNLTGAVAVYGVLNQGTVQSDVTSAAYNNFSQSNTAAAAFTLSNFYHNIAAQGTIGAGSAITNQYGYFADSSMTGAGNNFGFYGNIASGSNRYNLYMNGTADNYLAGALGIGATSLVGFNIYSNRNLTGATTSTSIQTSGPIQSDVTTLARSFGSYLQTSGAAWVLPSAVHYEAQQGSFGSTTVTNQFGFVVNSNLTGATNNYGFFSNIPVATGRFNFYAAGTADNYFGGSIGIGALVGTDTKFRIAGTYPSVGTASYVIRLDGTVPATSTGTAVYFDTFLNTEAAAFTLGTMVHYRARQNTLGAGSSVTSQYGFSVSSNMTGATYNYGFFGDIAAGSNRYNLYMNGTADNYMAGYLGLGAIPFAGCSLRIANQMTGATNTFGISNEGQVQSGSTGSAAYFRTAATTAAASYTVGALLHYVAAQSTIGAGSSISNQYGFTAQSSLTGATSNFGFYGNLASASGVWNFYAAGSASNYFAGLTGFGTTNLLGEVTVPNSYVGINDGFYYGGGAYYSSGSWRNSVSNQNGWAIRNTAGVFTVFTGTTNSASAAGTASTDFNEKFRIANDGRVGINSTVPNSTTMVYIGGTVSGNIAQYGVYSDSQFQSGVTSTGQYFTTSARTAAASFTLGQIVHYQATQGTFGAGSTVTYQKGFEVNNTLTGATNNYGFYSNIASGAGRYNFYAAGSAANYFAGDINTAGTLIMSNASPVINVGSAAVSTGDCHIEIGTARTGNGNAYIDFVGDTTYTDYGLRVGRQNSGANANSQIVNRGTGTLYIEAQDAGSVVLKSNSIDGVFVGSTGTVKNYSTISVGNATPASTGAGITFPATQSASSDANTLDDYEEGTFSPTITAAGGGSVGAYNTQTGDYVKVGGMVYFNLYVNYTKGTLSGALSVANLPFASKSGASHYYSITCGYWSGLATAIINSVTYIDPGVSTIVIRKNTAASANTNTTMLASDLGGGSNEIMFSGVYPAA